MAAIPFIDIFAGPGGLSEGFSRFSEFTGNRTAFRSRLAIEKDPVAAQTLRLRSFFRVFPEGHAPEAFYDVILSSRVRDDNGGDAGRVFERIRSDLSDPTRALASDADTGLLIATKQSRPCKYHLYSLVIGGERSGELVGDYGLASARPHIRHRKAT